MSACELQRGVVALRTCGGSAVMRCGSCSRLVCGEHLAQGAPPECIECAARRHLAGGGAPPPGRQAAPPADMHRLVYRWWLWETVLESSWADPTPAPAGDALEAAGFMVDDDSGALHWDGDTAGEDASPDSRLGETADLGTDLDADISALDSTPDDGGFDDDGDFDGGDGGD